MKDYDVLLYSLKQNFIVVKYTYLLSEPFLKVHFGDSKYILIIVQSISRTLI